MLKAFFRDSAVYGGARLLTGAVTLLVLPIYTHALDPSSYGVVDLLTTLANIVYVTVAFEIAQGLGRHVMSPDARSSRERYVSTALWFTVFAYSVFLVVTLPFAEWIGERLFGGPANARVVRIALLVMWSTGLFYFAQNVLRYELRAVQYACVSIVYTVVSVCTAAWLLLVRHLGVSGVFIGQLAGGIVGTSIALWFGRDAIRAIFDRARCREMLAFSVPLVPSGVGVLLSLYVDRYAVVHLLSVADLGVYGVAFRISSVVAVAVAGFQSSLAPLIYQHFDKPETPEQIARTMQWFLACSVPLVLFLGIFSGELTHMAAPSAYASAAPLVVMLSAALLVGSLYNFAPGLWIAKRTTWVALITIGTGIVNLLLNFALIPKFGLIGAAGATFFSAVGGCAVQFAVGQRFYPVPFRWSSIAVALVFGIGGFAILTFATTPSSHAFVARSLGWVVVSAVLAVVLLGRTEIGLLRSRLSAIARRSPDTPVVDQVCRR